MAIATIATAVMTGFAASGCGEDAQSGEEPAPGVAASPPSIPVGTIFRDCDVCPELVVLPAGGFLMGSPDSETEYSTGGPEGERPQHEVTIGYPFAIGVYEVTFDEWDACVSGGGCADPTDDRGWGRGRRPVVRAFWDDAHSYLGWLTDMTGHRYRLPSEAEWEYAARAGTTTDRYWGDDSSEQCTYENGLDVDGLTDFSPLPWYQPAECSDGYVHTAPVGSFRPNPFGIYDMYGNVQEWTEDCWHDSYHGAPSDGSARKDGRCNARVVRGGLYNYSVASMRSAARATIVVPKPGISSLLGIVPQGRWGKGMRVVREVG